MKKIIIILLFLLGMSQLQAISLSQGADAATTLFKRSAQVSALVPVTILGAVGLLEFLEKKGLKEKHATRFQHGPFVLLMVSIPFAAFGAALLNTSYATLNLIQNKSILEVPVANLMPSTFLQGVAGGLALLPAGYWVINKLFKDKIEKNSKLKTLWSAWHNNVNVYATIASTILSTASVFSEIGEKVFVG